MMEKTGTPRVAEAGWHVGEDRGAAHLASRGAESTAKTKATRKVVAERQFLGKARPEHANHIWNKCAESR